MTKKYQNRTERKIIQNQDKIQKFLTYIMVEGL